MYVCRIVPVTFRLSFTDLAKQVKAVAEAEGAKPEDCYFECFDNKPQVVVPCVTKQSQTGLE